MAQREDLERLAGECEVCSLADSVSIDNHMITCPSCVEHRIKADEIVGEVERMRDLAQTSDIERRHMLGYDVNDFLNMTETEREHAMKNMFDNMAELDGDHRTVVIRTRTDLITSLPKREREALLITARKIYSGYDQDRIELERKAIEEATASYNPLKRTMVRRMYQGLM
jgi:hypothetical protein